LVPGVPVVFDREPLLEKERRKDLEYSIGQLPKLRQPEDYTNSAELFHHYTHESVTDVRQMMDFYSLKYGLPSIALTSEMVPTPFANDFFLSNPPSVDTSQAGLILDKTAKFLRSIPSGTTLWVLWGDAGKLVIQCAKYLRYDIPVIFVGTSDYPLTLYDQYLGYIADEVNKDRFTKQSFKSTMSEFVAANNFSEVAVLANYVCAFVPQAKMFLQITLDRDERVLPGKENKTVRYVPAAMDYSDVADYFNMFMYKNDRERKNVKLYDPVRDVFFNYDHHRVWADQVTSSNGVPVRELLRAINGEDCYKGNLKILCLGDKQDFIPGDPRFFEPLGVAYLSLDASKMMFFEADQLAYVDYRGALPGTSKVISSVILAARVGSKWYLVDCDIGKRFVVRYMDISSSRMPSIVPSVGGRYAIPWQTKDLYSLVKVNYTQPLEYHQDSVRFVRQTFYGLSISGESIVYDGCSQFEYSPNPLFSHIKSNSKLSWKVRFARNRDKMSEGFYFQVLFDDYMGEEFVLAHVDLLGLPPDIAQSIKFLCTDYDEGFVAV